MTFNPDQALQLARETLDIEAEALMGLKSRLDARFSQAVQMMLDVQGRVVVTGMGKSGHIGSKIAATLASTGTPAMFVHPGEASHGDLGMIKAIDVVLAISNSGESDELVSILPVLKRLGVPLIAMTGGLTSALALHADVVLDSSVSKEACPLNLAPTASTTAQLVMGDALAICLMHLSGFTGNDFARFHPGGNLGKRLSLLAGDLAAEHEQPRVLPSASLKTVIVEITEKRLGVTAVVDEKDAVIGIITDGDLRRMLEKRDDIRNIQASEIMSPHPKTISPNALAAQALEEMRAHDISQLIVAENGQYRGIVHLHDLIKEGII